MALDAMLPQDGRHVPGERDLLPRRGRPGEHAASKEQPSEPDPPPGTINRPSRHDPPPSVPPPDVDKTWPEIDSLRQRAGVHRIVAKQARNSATNVSGCSNAAKWPPVSSTL